MRFKGGSRSSEQDEALQTNSADFVLQVGSMKVPLKAEKLLGGSVRVSSKANMPLKAEKLLGPPALNEEDKAIEAFSRMQEAFSGPAQQAQNGGSWAPWSPDDLYPHGRPPSQSPQAGTRNIPATLRREPWEANLPGYYDPASQRHNNQASNPIPIPVVRNSTAPTIFDNLSGPQSATRDTANTDMKKDVETSRRSKATKRSASAKPRKLDLVQLLPQTRPSTSRVLSPCRASSSPSSSLTERADCPLPPLPKETSDSSTNRSKARGKAMMRSSTTATTTKGIQQKVPDEATLDQHKTNRRRPPKGIQNWFDAYYLESDEDEEDNEEDDEDEEEFQQISPPTEPQSEPQELPADELPPAYSAPSREMSRASEKSGSYTGTPDPVPDILGARDRSTVEEEMERYRTTNESHSWDSIQSSHIGRIPPDESNERLATSTGARQSVLSLSDSEFTDGVSDEGPRLATMGDRVLDDRVVTIASASSLDLHKLSKAHLEQTRNHLASHESESSLYSPKSKAMGQPRRHPTAEQGALRKLSKDSCASSSGAALHDGGSDPADAAHIMAVTEEEKMILDLMRRKRTVVQNVSFTEGYQMALQAEQQRIAQSGTPAERDALRTLQRAEFARRDSEMSSIPSPADTADMRRQLSAMRREQVDGRFQIERFLGSSEPRPIDSYPPDGPIELPSKRLSGELLPATVYSPVGTPLMTSPAFHQDSFQSPDHHADAEDIKRRVEQFIATNGAVPPLNTQIKLMQRQPKGRRGSSMPPSPVMEEEQQPPPAIPIRSPDRGGAGGHTRGLSDLTSKISSVSLDTDLRTDSPVSAFPTTTEADLSVHSQQPQQQLFSPVPSSRRENITSRANATASASPFSSLIKAASHSDPRHSKSSENLPYTPTTTGGNNNERPSAPVRNSSDRLTGAATSAAKKLPSPISRYSSATTSPSTERTDSSFPGMSSAGEDVLAAWHNLGGGMEGLNGMTRKVKHQTSGPLSGLMNA